MQSYIWVAILLTHIFFLGYLSFLFHCVKSKLRCVKTGKHVIMQVHRKTNIRTLRLCVHVYTLHYIVRFLLSPFPIVSVAVWITVFARFDRCLNLYFNRLQNNGSLAGGKLFRIWKTCHRAHKQHKYIPVVVRLRLCVRFKYASFYRRFQSFQSLNFHLVKRV